MNNVVVRTYLTLSVLPFTSFWVWFYFVGVVECVLSVMRLKIFFGWFLVMVVLMLWASCISWVNRTNMTLST